MSPFRVKRSTLRKYAKSLKPFLTIESLEKRDQKKLRILSRPSIMFDFKKRIEMLETKSWQPQNIITRCHQ